MSFRKFLKSKVFWLNVILAVVLTLIMLWLTMYALSKYTHHGEAFPTPNLTGLEKTDWEKIASDKQIEVVIRDSVYNTDYKPGSIIEQLPRTGHYIKAGRTIYVTVAAVKPEMVQLPKLTDVSLRQARVLLESSSLKLGEVTYSPSEYNSLVLAQKLHGANIDPGILVPRGTPIDLVVGKTMENQRTIVPDLTGYTYDAGRKILQDVSLTVGAVIYSKDVKTEEDSTNAVIWQQSPQFNRHEGVEIGHSVDLWLKLPVDSLSDDGN
jgi:beta-lactam-binding protein with PASTA domain